MRALRLPAVGRPFLAVVQGVRGSNPGMLALILLLLMMAVSSIGCRSVTERMSLDADEGIPPAEGVYRHSTDTVDPLMIEEWWTLFNDPTLDALIVKLNAANPDAAAALARVDQSYAAMGITRGPTYPTIRGNVSGGRRRDSINNLLFPIATPEYNRFMLGASATWELDLWGRVRASVKRDRLRAEAEAVNYYDVLLSLQASLAQQYFAHRAAQTESNLLQQSRDLAAEHLKMQEARLRVGQGIQSDVSNAKLELQNAQTALEASKRNTGKLLHAIAILTGTMPSKLPAMNPTPLPAVPEVPAGLPSDLLARRPDLLAAERQLRSAAVQVGIRKADFLPKISLVGSGGVASLKANNLFEADSGTFDLGPEVDIAIFQYKLRKNAVAQAKAQFREAAEKFRSSFLTAVKEVDDALLDANSYTREHALQRDALQSATESALAAWDRFDIGLTNYFDFISAERTRLQAAAREATLTSECLLASVRLIQALGGSWLNDQTSTKDTE